jgi:prepilin-type N-terminal cleavage/methylation domain-containing protein
MRRGFTLIELSIVLVIIGLLTGGILAGRSLIQSAAVRSVATDYLRYKAAFQNFRDQYGWLPGDFTKATQFWGSAGGTGADAACQAAAHTGTLTCNGNGNGFLDVSGIQEQYHSWQHLALAGLIEGSYTAADAQIPGTTVPKSKIANSYFHARNGNNYGGVGTGTVSAGDGGTYNADFGINMFRFRSSTWDTNASNTAALRPDEAWDIDKKVDDGLPGSGIVIAQKGNGTTVFCTSAAGVAPPSDVNSTYRLDINARDCVIDFAKAF